MTENGIDVSMWQDGVINYGRVRQDASWAYVKLTEGSGYRDPAAGRHVNGFRGGGLVVGGYHFARPDTNSPETDAETFASALRDHGLAQPGALPPCLDMEKNAGVNMISWTQRLAERVRQLTGYAPIMIYANRSWWQNQLGGGGWLDDQMWAWVAEYGVSRGAPNWNHPRSFGHQWTDAWRIGSSSAPVDGNVSWVDLGVVTQGGQPSPGTGPAPAPDPRPDGWWEVRVGQTLSGIGAAVGIDWRTLAQWNNLANPDMLHVGQRLRLTPPEAGTGGSNGGTYTVRPGQTLSAIGAEVGVSWQDIYAANRGLIKDPDVIQAGWVLLIPGAGSTPAPPSTERVYIVRSGDNLSAIGERLGVRWRWLAEVNGIRDPYTIYPDQRLKY